MREEQSEKFNEGLQVIRCGIAGYRREDKELLLISLEMALYICTTYYGFSKIPVSQNNR